MLKIAKDYPAASANLAKKSGFFFSVDETIRAVIASGIKWSFILDTIKDTDEIDLHRLMVMFNNKAKTCKTACVFIRDNTLFYGFNHNCGIAIFDKGGRIKFQTSNNQQYGVFTGHRSYEKFISTGVVPVEKGDTVILYDGNFDQYLKQPNFYKILFDKKFEKLIDDLVEKDKTRKEQSLLVFTL